MVRASKALAGRIGIYKNNMHYPKDLPNNKFEPLSSDSQTQDGLKCALDDMQRQCVKAQQMKGERNGFLCKHLNIWTNAETAWLDLER
ncbi:hypothetical protein [Piscirickettsia salmonis]|uniref:hypothetical protein n=1 Tax=Piscirickettsia salmonis TaxID=1238 RepID=UPI00166264B0|nr:hypothetical protein [Piscirickettsia salmonis]QNR82480.1 hypothetical protein ICC15_18590 [Piscirickettsia salmonis]